METILFLTPVEPMARSPRRRVRLWSGGGIASRPARSGARGGTVGDERASRRRCVGRVWPQMLASDSRRRISASAATPPTAAAATPLVAKAGATLVLAPGSSRLARALAWCRGADRGRIDTHSWPSPRPATRCSATLVLPAAVAHHTHAPPPAVVHAARARRVPVLAWRGGQRRAAAAGNPARHVGENARRSCETHRERRADDPSRRGAIAGRRRWLDEEAGDGQVHAKDAER